MEEKINQIRSDFLEKINHADTLENLDTLFLKLFGKNGLVTLLPKDFAKEPKELLQKIGPLFNATKQTLEKTIDDKRTQIREAGYKLLVKEKFDLAPTEIKKRQGYFHPITKFEKEIVDIFKSLGFSQFDAPEIDTDKNNFEVLNIPPEHPARDLWDTLYLDTPASGNSKLLLRTHTSNSQIRIMKSTPLPIRMMNLGRCFTSS